jgi:hypothetical protein
MNFEMWGTLSSLAGLEERNGRNESYQNISTQVCE